MTITLKLFATLKKYGSEISEKEIEPGTSVGEVIADLKIPENICHLRIVNNVHVPLDHILRDGDTLALFPPIAGG